MSDIPTFSFDIRPGPEGWIWRALTPKGLSRTGAAPTRAAAAACVIRVLTDAAVAGVSNITAPRRR